MPIRISHIYIISLWYVSSGRPDQSGLGGVLLLATLARHHLRAPEVRHLDAHDREVRDVEVDEHRGLGSA